MRKPGVTYEPFDVVVVPFPFSDRFAAKKRPAVVVSGIVFGQQRRRDTEKKGKNKFLNCKKRI